jgi:hypothetical protein
MLRDFFVATSRATCRLCPGAGLQPGGLFRQRRGRHSRLFFCHAGGGYCVQSFDERCRGVKMDIDIVQSCR